MRFLARNAFSGAANGRQVGNFSSAGRAFQTRHVSKEAAARAPAISRSVAFLSGAESRRRRRSAGALRAATVSSTAATAACRYSCSRSSSASRPAFGALPKRSSPAPRQAAFQAAFQGLHLCTGPGTRQELASERAAQRPAPLGCSCRLAAQPHQRLQRRPPAAGNLQERSRPSPRRGCCCSSSRQGCVEA